MAVTSATFATLIGSLAAVALYRYRFVVKVCWWYAVCGDDVARYCDGDFIIGFIYAIRHFL